MANTGASYELNTEAAVTAIIACVRAGIVPMVWGPPGIGKSAIARFVAARLKRIFQDVRANLLDPVDIRGIPYRDGTTTHWAAPVFFPRDAREYVVCIDELPSGLPATQASLYQVLLDRMIGETKIPDGVAFMACGNRESDHGVAYKMPTPLASRVMHIDLQVDHGAWQRWAAGANIRPEVIFYLVYKEKNLHVFDPVNSDDHTFPCPRTWEFVSNLLNEFDRNPVDPATEKAMYVGTIGTAVAVEFFSFLRMFRELTHPKEVIAYPGTCTIPLNAAAQIALCGALYRQAKETNFGAICEFASRADLRREIGQFLVGQCVQRNPDLQETAGYNRWVVANQY